MTNFIFLIIGVSSFLGAVSTLALDCKGKTSCSMGGNMLFGFLWNLGAVIFLLGVLPIFSLSRWWIFLGLMIIFALSIPVHRIISKLFCAPYEPEKSGFQKFIRKTENHQSTDRED